MYIYLPISTDLYFLEQITDGRQQWQPLIHIDPFIEIDSGTMFWTYLLHASFL